MAYTYSAVGSFYGTDDSIEETQHYVAYPSAAVGDLLITVFWVASAAVTITPPVGWTTISGLSHATPNLGYKSFAKVVTVDGSGTELVTTSAAVHASARTIKLLPATEEASVDATAWGKVDAVDTVLGSSLDAPFCSFDEVDDWFVFAVQHANVGSALIIPPVGYTILVDQAHIDGDMHAYLGYKILTTVGSADPPVGTYFDDVTGVVGTIGFRTLVTASLEEIIRPVADSAAAGWDSAPTASQDLWAQVDEVVASDTDYIFVEDPNP